MSSESEPKQTLREDMWFVISTVSERLSKVDHVKLLANDIVRKVTEHFENIRIVQTMHQESSNPQKVPQFSVFPHLMSEERECEYLSKLAEALIILICPPDYGQAIPVRHLLRELLARHVFAPAIDKITHPAYINSKIISFIKKNQSVRELSQKTFTYADSYEEFLKLINTTVDVNEITQIRYNILTEIMQATTMENLRVAKGTTVQSQDQTKKSGLASPRHMKRYIR